MLRRFFALVLVSAFAIACQGKTTQPAADSTPEKLCHHMVSLLNKEAPADMAALSSEERKKDLEDCIEGAEEGLKADPAKAKEYAACVMAASSLEALLKCEG